MLLAVEPVLLAVESVLALLEDEVLLGDVEVPVVVVLCKDVPLVVVLAETEAAVTLAVVAAADSLYIFRRLPAPQSSESSPGHSKLQSAWLATLILPVAGSDPQ